MKERESEGELGFVFCSTFPWFKREIFLKQAMDQQAYV